MLIAAYSAGSAERLGSLLTEHGAGETGAVAQWQDFRALPKATIGLAVLAIERGYGFDDVALVTEQDILGDRLSRPPRRRANYDQFVAEVSALAPGDLVVHAEHGIGRYDGLVTLDVAGAPHDCLRVIYAGDDKLFVPVENIDVLSRYGSENAGVAARQAGRRRLAGAQGAGQEAHQGYGRGADRGRGASASSSDGEAMPPPEGALRRIRRPLSLSRDRRSGPRDRRRAGRSGLGQADGSADLRRCRLRQDRGGAARRLRRGAWRACRSRWWCRRRCWRASISAPSPSALPGLPVRIAQLSRLVPAKRGEPNKKELAEGRVDIVVGTHALLAKDQLQASGPADRRRGAAFRRRAEGTAEGAQGQCPCADPDRDADPAHPAAGAGRRARDERDRDAAGRPAGGAHLRAALSIRWWCARRSCASIIAAGRASTSRRASPTSTRSQTAADGAGARDQDRDRPWPDGARPSSKT